MNIPHGSTAVALIATILLGGCAATGPAAGQAPGTPPAAPVEEAAGSPAAPPDRAVQTQPQSNAEVPTLALLQQSERSADSGDLAGAIAYVERAIRLNSRDAELWLRLASLQLRAQRPATAEQLAQKAIALAGNRDDQRRRGWLLVADAREAQGDGAGAAEIRDRWRTFRG